jgi:hypothetical protein
MKRVVVIVLLLLTGTASARVVMTLAIPRTCREGSWEKLVKCITRFGEPKVVRELPGVKLVAVASPKFQVPGLYLYRQSGKTWVIAGMFEVNGTFEVFSMSTPTIAKHTGYRFDVGTVEDTSGEGGKSILQQKVSVFCSGGEIFCSAVTTSCDYLVDGRAKESFRGKLSIDPAHAIAKVTGDSSHSGTMCSPITEVTLDFSVQRRMPPPSPIEDPLF